MAIDAIILAGASNHGALRAVTDTPYEALIDIEGRAMLDYVVDAVVGSRDIERVVVVGPEKALASLAGRVYRVAQCGDSMVENILIGLEVLHSTGKVLLVTSDIPLLTTDAIGDFLRRCAEKEADIHYPVVAKQTNEASYPGVKRTYVHLVEGTFTGGNLALLDPEVVRQCHVMIEKAVQMRKKPWQLSRLLGFRFIVKFLLSRLSVAEIEERVRLMLGFRGVAIVSPYPEIGIDVDKPSDLELARNVLGARRQTGQQANQEADQEGHQEAAHQDGATEG